MNTIQKQSSLSGRWKFLESRSKRLFSLDGLRAIFTRPQVVVDVIREFFFDVRIRPVPLDVQLAGVRGSVDTLARLASQWHHPLQVKEISEVVADVSNGADCLELARLFRLHGSDKSTVHNYYLVYGTVLQGKRHEPLQILEIGLGTNNIDTPSNMGATGRPGASLRAFRDWAPNATVVGADVDRRVLFTEDRITTHFVDQTAPETIAALAGNFTPASFDLVIDDGLHTPEANLNAIAGLLNLVKSGGSMIIEDVDARTFPYWQIAFPLLGPAYSCAFVKTQAACLCLIRKLPARV